MAENWFNENEVSSKLGGMLAGANNEGPGDAFRHALASALYTQKYGPFVAAILGNLNEAFAFNDSKYATEADLYNNELGREIGQVATTPEEATMMLIDMMNKSIDQESYWGGAAEESMLDPDALVKWNRQLYKESPSHVRRQLGAMQELLDQGMFRQDFDYFR
jgi:hypothetical protein